MTDGRRRDLVSLATFSLAAAILGHHLVFLTSYGPRYWAMLERTGHGPAWAVTVATVGILSAGIVFLALRRFVSLSQLSRSARAGELSVTKGRAIDLASHVMRLWVVVFAVALVLFVVNENLERAASALPLPGVAILLGGAGTGAPILIFAAVAAGIALVAGLYRWRREILVARLAATRAPWSRPVSATAPHREPWVARKRPSAVGSRLAGRAPPLRALLRSSC